MVSLLVKVPPSQRAQRHRACRWNGRRRDDVFGLTLGADQQNGFVGLGQRRDEIVGFDRSLSGLLEIDDVDPIALAEDVRAHFRVPTAALGAKMNTGFDKLFDGDNCHLYTPAPSARERMRNTPRVKFAKMARRN